MVIRKDNTGYLTLSGNHTTNFTDWQDSDIYVIDEDSELGQKFLSLSPNCDIITNEFDNMVDVIEITKPIVAPPPTLEEQLTNLQLALIELYESKGV